MEGVLADTGFVVALVNRSDRRHRNVVPIYQQYPQIPLPQLVLGEVAYLIGRDAGIATTVRFLKGIPASRFETIFATDADIARAAMILEQYIDSKVDFVDACIMAIAERLDIPTVLTIDRRDFQIFRPRHCQGFILKP
ncbi:putative nucleic acid-binding protein, contains PIN domain protein [Rubidibacter lacunae KORDI 51-2]|uniref:Putative nucleic acid-binding protein, contains PIN domain protein n=1 Tax=Rubidibacter lacunae KORDI 51-2 TaxID=582515 RepID=U5DK12_9CHRO|nr:PIN domain-containing protein [Rubidibacter lacunae]ERN41247.1 putative nucleic acid-binding protein, contains PIN domain protein [Rubidibacter lacunae KORDI 51-2]